LRAQHRKANWPENSNQEYIGQQQRIQETGQKNQRGRRLLLPQAIARQKTMFVGPASRILDILGL
jgi:hypothetical protein